MSRVGSKECPKHGQYVPNDFVGVIGWDEDPPSKWWEVVFDVPRDEDSDFLDVVEVVDRF